MYMTFFVNLAGSVAVLAPNIGGHGPMASAVARAYKEGLGADPPSGIQWQSPWSGGQRGEAKPPEAEALLVSGRLMEAANLPTFLKFGNANQIFVLSLQKILGGHETWSKTGGCALPVRA